MDAMATRSRRTGIFVATDDAGNEQVLVIHTVEVDFLSPPSGKWEEVYKNITTEGGEVVSQREQGVYETASGKILRSHDRRAP